MRFVLVTLSLLTMHSVSLAQQMITEEQAEQAVRTFQANSSLEFESIAQSSMAEGPTWAHRTWFILTDNNTGGTDRWKVNAYSGEVESAYYQSQYPPVSEYTDTPTGPYTQEQCRQIALNLVTAKYADFGSMGFQLNEEEWIGSGWSFCCVQTLTNGAATPNSVSAEVDPSTGEVQAYFGLRVSMPAPSTVAVTSQQASDSAALATGIVSDISIDGPVLFADPDGTYWNLVIEGLDTLGDPKNYWVRVDALTGLVLDTQSAMVHPVARKKAESDSSSEELVWIRQLPLKDCNAKVHWLGRNGARLVYKSTIWQLYPGSTYAISKGYKLDIGRKVVLFHGKLLVPNDLLDKIGRVAQELPKK